MKKIVIIIPTYQEALTIKETIHQIFSETKNLLDEVHVLIFDSQSKDNTQPIVQQLQTQYPRLHLKTEEKKSGLGSAYLQAMRYALNTLKADIIFEFDADLSHQPHYLPHMIKQLDTHDVVLGSRYIPEGSIPKDWAWHRKCFSILGNLIARTVLTRKYKDFTSGFRGTTRNALETALPKTQFLSNHYAYKIELLWRLHRCGYKIIEYPIVFIDRTHGESKLPTNSIIDTLRVLFLLRLASILRRI